MKDVPTLLRKAEHEALSRIVLEGSVLDLGGDARGGYRRFIKGEHSFVTVNLDTKTKPDIFHDLESPLPESAGPYDHAILINVLEHVFNCGQLLSEAVRVIKPGGTVVVIVPFVFPVHPSPHDYWRFTGETLARLMANAGISDVHIQPLGAGVFSARYVMLDRLLPRPVRLLSFYSLRYLSVWLDALFVSVARATGKKYMPADYPLGYCAVGTKADQRRLSRDE